MFFVGDHVKYGWWYRIVNHILFLNWRFSLWCSGLLVICITFLFPFWDIFTEWEQCYFVNFFFWISCDWRNEQFVASCFGVSVRAMNIVCGVIGSLMSICPLNINVFFSIYLHLFFLCFVLTVFLLFGFVAYFRWETDLSNY